MQQYYNSVHARGHAAKMRIDEIALHLCRQSFDLCPGRIAVMGTKFIFDKKYREVYNMPSLIAVTRSTTSK